MINRPYHAFLSYSHKDREIALKLHRWLTHDAGFNIWFDDNHLEASSPVAARLAEQMESCRNWMVIASKNSLASAWVKSECEQALHCATIDRSFHLLPLRVDDCPLGQAWPYMSRFKWLEIPEGTITGTVAREIFNRLDGRSWSGRLNVLRDIYVSRGWRPADRSFADAVCQGLCNRRWQLRLIGDATDQTAYSSERITGIISSCCGHVAVLPRRGSGGPPTDYDYRYIMGEVNASAQLGIPTLLLTEGDTQLPPSIASSVVRLSPGEDYDSAWSCATPDWLENFTDELKGTPSPQHVFLAAEFRDNVESLAQLRDFVEAVTGMRCDIGRDYEGENLRRQIVNGIVSASIVIANIASLGETPNGVPGVNYNTCVEAGIALGAFNVKGVKPPPLFLTVQSPSDERGRTERLPFMFRDSQITWYANEAELFAHCRRILFPYRRRIMNYEFENSV